MIEMEKVSFSYYSSAQNANISQIDLTIRDTECVLLCGRSGCGKTTLIRLINGLIPSFYSGELSGSVLINGKSVQETPLYQLAEHVGSVFQNPRSQFFNVDTEDGLQRYRAEKNKKLHSPLSMLFRLIFIYWMNPLPIWIRQLSKACEKYWYC